MSTELLLAVHAAATLTMAGVIWFVQLVHYPSFADARGCDFADFSRQHQSRTGRLVGPLMLVEAAAALLLLATGGPRLAKPAALGVALLAVIWISTVFAQMPLHRRLLAGFDLVAVRRLVRTNWLRTAAWTGRGLLATLMLAGRP